MAKRMGFVVNVDKCIGCSACAMACKDYNALDPAMHWRTVHRLKEDSFGTSSRVFLSLACNHCDKPACLKVCPANAYEKREDGIVIHHADRCIGCKMCIMACPYKAPQFNEKKNTVEKCHMCYKLLDKGEAPGCVNTCPVGAIQVVDMNKEDQSKFETSFPGYPDPSITEPTTGLIRPSTPKRVIANK